MSERRGSYDPIDTRAQDLARVEAEELKRIVQHNEDEDFKWLMKSVRGRRIVWRLLEEAGVFRISFNTNSMQMAFNEGGRNYGNKILDQVHKLCPELYPTMLNEATRLKESTNVNRNDD